LRFDTTHRRIAIRGTQGRVYPILRFSLNAAVARQDLAVRIWSPLATTDN
jgi:hypothetical protein